MFKINELGRSMVEMLGVLAIIGVLSGGGLAGYGKAMYKYRLHKSISYVADAIVEYQLFSKRIIGTYPTETNKMAESARKYGLLSVCEPQPSSIAGTGYQTCKFPLGEVYPRFFITDKANGTNHTYMLYVTLLKNKKQACIDFLNPDWSKIASEKLWRKGKLWITSDSNTQVLYSASVNNLDLTNVVQICETVCGDTNAPYCSIVFDFTYIRY